MFRSKTAKRGSGSSKKNTLVITPITPANMSDISGNPKVADMPKVEPVKPVEISTESMLSALLDAESRNNSTAPWLRLDRGYRMKLLRSYIEKLPDYSASERVEILAAVVEALDKKLLNSKSQISYDPAKGITDINSLKISRGPNKLIVRVDPPNRATKKAKRQSSDNE